MDIEGTGSDNQPGEGKSVTHEPRMLIDMRAWSAPGKLGSPDLRTDVQNAAVLLNEALRRYPAKTHGTRHGVLGPAADIVRLAGRPGSNFEHGAARALRMFEMVRSGTAVRDSATIESLRRAAQAVFTLRESCPPQLWRSTSSLVLDHVYFLRRQEEAKFWEGWPEFLRRRYASQLGGLSDAWGLSSDARPEDWGHAAGRDYVGNEGRQSDFRDYQDEARLAVGEDEED